MAAEEENNNNSNQEDEDKNKGSSDEEDYEKQLIGASTNSTISALTNSLSSGMVNLEGGQQYYSRNVLPSAGESPAGETPIPQVISPILKNEEQGQLNIATNNTDAAPRTDRPSSTTSSSSAAATSIQRRRQEKCMREPPRRPRSNTNGGTSPAAAAAIPPLDADPPSFEEETDQHNGDNYQHTPQPTAAPRLSTKQQQLQAQGRNSTVGNTNSSITSKQQSVETTDALRPPMRNSSKQREFDDSSLPLEMAEASPGLPARRRAPTGCTISSNNDHDSRVGAFCEPGRALGERPIWDRPTVTSPTAASLGGASSPTAAEEYDHFDEEQPPRLQQQQQQQRRQQRHQDSNNSSSNNSSNNTLDEENIENGRRPILNRRRSHLFSRNRMIVEASPVSDAEAIVYATSVSSEEEQKKRRLYLILAVVVLVTICVCTVVGVIMSNNSAAAVASKRAGCQPTSRGGMKAREECKCFGELAPLDEWRLANYTKIRQDLFTAIYPEPENMTEEVFWNFNATACTIENIAILTLLETVSGPEDELHSFVRCDNNTKAAESYMAIKFYLALNGDHWYQKEGWLDGSPCLWYGVECTISGRVSGLWLNGNNVSGNLAKHEIPWKSSLLREIRLGNNQLSGELPTSIFQVSTLRVLDLRNNRLSGTLPTTQNFSRIINSINLSNNSFTGPFPAQFGPLERLRTLYLEENRLTGTIPSEIAQMTSLEDFVVNDNNLSGTLPTDVSQLKYLEVFNVHNNSLVGEIPDSYGSLPRIRFMDLSFNNFTGNIPNRLRKCQANEDDIETILLDCGTFDNVPKPNANAELTCPTESNCLVCSETFARHNEGPKSVN